MSAGKREYELVGNIDHYLSVLSKLYAQENEILKQEIIVNARARVVEEWSIDNWNGGTFGHALYLVLPEILYLRLARVRTKLQEQIKADINGIHNVQNEFIEVVFLEAQQQKNDNDWRSDSGLLVKGKLSVSPAIQKRIWGEGKFRLFLSHKSQIKTKVAELKKELEVYGISCFVAHKDIKPTKKWQDEIESALSSMDALVALMTEKFHNSKWTDQEVGYAFGRGVPIVAVKLGTNPYGFIGKFQALSCKWDKLPIELVKLFIKEDAMVDAYIGAVEKCKNWNQANVYAEVLPYIEKLSKAQTDRIVEAYNNNNEISGSFGFNGEKPTLYGRGLVHYLSKITGKEYVENSDSEIELLPL